MTYEFVYGGKSNLLPCPFCNRTPMVSKGYEGVETIVCPGCGIMSSGHYPMASSRMEAAAKWNRRASPNPLTDEEICDIAKQFVTVIGGHWENDYGIHERSVEDFARAIERAHGIGGE